MGVVPGYCVIWRGGNRGKIFGDGYGAIEDRGEEFGRRSLRREDFVKVFVFQSSGVDDFTEGGDGEEIGRASKIFRVAGRRNVLGEGGEDCGGDFIVRT